VAVEVVEEVAVEVVEAVVEADEVVQVVCEEARTSSLSLTDMRVCSLPEVRRTLL
jgi:hypothetical protein